MTFSIKRNSDAPELPGISADTNYPVLAFTDHNVVIVSDDNTLLTIGYKQVNTSDDWTLVQDKPKKAEQSEDSPTKK